MIKGHFHHVMGEVAWSHGWSLSVFADGWLSKFSREGRVWYVAGYVLPLNTAGAHMLAKDKVAGSCVLEEAGIPVVPHRLLTPDALEEQLRRVEQDMGFPVVIKPNQGLGGVGVVKVDAFAELRRTVSDALTHARDCAVSPYRPFAREMRSIILDGACLLQFEKIPRGDWRHNLSLGADAQLLQDPFLADQVCALAVKTTASMGLRLAAVDSILSPAGLEVLEVNSTITLEKASRLLPEGEDRVRMVYDTIFRAIEATV